MCELARDCLNLIEITNQRGAVVSPSRAVVMTRYRLILPCAEGPQPLRE